MIFVFVMFWVIYGLTPQAGYTAMAFFIGAIVSILSGTIGMMIATQANFRTTTVPKRALPMPSEPRIGQDVEWDSLLYH